MTSATTLSREQLRSLHDILSHANVYQEAADFKNPGTLDSYGPPFSTGTDPKDREPTTPSASPVLQALFTKFVTTLPGLKDFPASFWQTRVASIIGDLEAAELSESYDKGVVGIRRTLATASSSLIEYPARGIITGFEPPELSQGKDDNFDLSSAEDLQRAFWVYLQQSVYGDAIDETVKTAGRTLDLKDHTPLVQAVHEFGLVNLASFMHYTLILSPKGQNLIVLLDLTHKMIPYAIIKQTLKIGNVATMISAMAKIILAKMSMGSVTNWMGWTNQANEGMNLLQQIISGVLGWESSGFKSKAAKIEKNKKGPSQDQLNAIKAYLSKSREEHDAIRSYSQQESCSIVHAILSSANVSTTLTPEQHQQALDYLFNLLSVRDRDQIIKVLCRSNPDHLSEAVRTGVNSFEPIIRGLHNAVNLSESLGNLERWLSDLIKLSKLPSGSKAKEDATPTVGDFIELFRKHQGSLHKFLHQCIKNGPELTKWFFDWGKDAVTNFRRQTNDDDGGPAGVGDVSKPLHALYASLAPADQERVLPILNAHSAHLATLHASSLARLKAVVASPPSRHASRAVSPARHSETAPPPDPGPGAYLARWQDLLDHSAITPAEATGGKLRTGGSGTVMVSSQRVMTAETDDKNEASSDSATRSGSAANPSTAVQPDAADADADAADLFEDAHEKLESFGLQQSQVQSEAANVELVVQLLGKKYREMLGKRFSKAGL